MHGSLPLRQKSNCISLHPAVLYESEIMAENLRQIDYIIPESFHGHTVEAFLRSEGYSRTTLYHLRNTRALSAAEHITTDLPAANADDQSICASTATIHTFVDVSAANANSRTTCASPVSIGHTAETKVDGIDGLVLNGHRSHLKEVLATGDRLRCNILETEDSPHVVETEIPLSIVYEDEDILVVDKPAGLPIHPSMGHYEHTLGNALCWYTHHVLGYEHYVNRIVNRLDRDTSGLLIAAKNMHAAARLGDMIRAHAIQREYLAIASGDVRDLFRCADTGAALQASTVSRCTHADQCETRSVKKSPQDGIRTLSGPPLPSGLYLSRSADPVYARARLQNLDGRFPDSLANIPALFDPANPVLGLHFTVDAAIGRKEDSVIERCIDYVQGDYAVTHGLLLSYNEEKDLSLLRLKLETGRTHQIRVHMKYLGHPLPGDFLYHPDERFITRQPLHSWRLRFRHPISGKLLELTAPLPEDMLRLL